MAGLVIIPNYMPALDANGNPISGAKATFYVNNTTTPLTVYQDADLETQHESPVVADSSGVFPLMYTASTDALRVKVQNATDVQLALYDDVFPIYGTSGGIALTPEMFGAKGSGNNDTAALNLFRAAVVGGRRGWLSGLYTTTSELVWTLNNCVIEGAPGLGGITGSFGYAVLKLQDCTNVELRNLKFQTLYSNATEDLAKAIVYSVGATIGNLKVIGCEFTAPNANTSGFSIYSRQNANDFTGSINDLFIEECNYHDIGRIGTTIFNRSVAADQYTSHRRIHINNNKFVNIGLSGDAGQAVSFDGVAEDFTFNGNTLRNCLVIGIENTGWRNGTFYDNKFDDFRGGRVWAPMSFSNQYPVKYDTITSATWATDVVTIVLQDRLEVAAGVPFSITVSGFTPSGYNGTFTATAVDEHTLTYPHVGDPGAVTVTGHLTRQARMTGLTLRDNQCLSPANSRSNFIGVARSYFDGNNWDASGDYAFAMRDAFFNTVRDTFVSDSYYAILIGEDGTSTYTQLNVFTECVADNSASNLSYATVRFSSVGTMHNRFNGRILSPAGGAPADQAASATENAVTTYDNGTSFSVNQLGTVAMSDADYTADYPFNTIVYDALKFTGTLTSGRKVTFPAAVFSRPKRALNSTGQTLTFYVGSSAGDTLANGASGTLVYDGASNKIKVIP